MIDLALNNLQGWYAIKQRNQTKSNQGIKKAMEHEGDCYTNWNWLKELEMGGWAETIQSRALLRSARILRRVLDTRGNMLRVRFLWKTISKRWCEKLARINIKIYLSTVICYQLFLPNTNNWFTVTWSHVFLFHINNF